MPAEIESTYVYVVRFNVNEGREEEFDEWYVRMHGPDVLLKVPGFVEARSYRTSIGPQRVLSIYDITDPAILGTPVYAKMRADDPQGNDLRASGLSNSTLCIYSEVARCPKALGGGRPEVPRFTSPYVTTIRFGLGEDANIDALTKWYATTGPTLEPQESALASYLCKHSADHPAAPTSDPGWIIITDWIAEDGGAPSVDDVVAQVAEAAGTEVTDVTYDFGRRMYTYRGGV